MLKNLLVILHALAAIGFFGLGLPLARMAKAALTRSGDARAALLEQGALSIRGMTGAGVFAAITAFATLVVGIQQGVPYGWPYHAASLLILVLLAVHVFGTARVWKGLSGDAPETALGKVSAFVGLSHLLWLALFLLMFAKYFGIGV
ncbi:MAG: hypothetical protein IAE99_10190 [Rhodothermales bacterium]|nr:hypothetical protein [Rhodothermales bacterium]MCA0267648.1 hypothetical protein [Bacteroidota bacterium]